MRRETDNSGRVEDVLGERRVLAKIFVLREGEGGAEGDMI